MKARLWVKKSVMFARMRAAEEGLSTVDICGLLQQPQYEAAEYMEIFVDFDRIEEGAASDSVIIKL
jgi:hypothetical protein